MENIDLSQYQVKEVIQPEIERDALDDRMDQIYPIMQDRSIPEKNKVLLQQEYNQLMDMKVKKVLSGPLPTMVLERK
ncbi:hypothetical protein [Paenibacillus cucumis (ex Kampfer et al. 2016)]|uniref:Uncharacterized protein n=1 Tax=Paenibacillus cucumis (ex Kampfer et al. 2016) TaxID=1776858 RepID=A0ABS7KMA7_9BACL|nr:hypothetical protein [Paenibacillus cucumis (ex Kampfer et al. 2016)]MBY0205265.1 hypothetical protein [Paenibacillus cucumis (ex Kampfer et al. 2016)]